MAAKNREELLSLIPAYALGALDEPERAEFERWLEADPEAQTILADYQAVADQLVALVPLRHAPDHLHADLRQRLGASRPESAAPPVERRAQRARRSWVRSRIWILAAAAVLAVVFVGVLLIWFTNDDEPAPDPATQLFAQLKEQPGTAKYDVVPGEVNDKVWGYLLVSAQGDQAVLCMWELPAITDEQAFQMWLIDAAGARTSAGIFQGNPSKRAIFMEVPLTQPISAYQGVGVSLEPAGGSPYTDQPSGPRVLSVRLS
jgi:anti-sigma-K factor RskA